MRCVDRESGRTCGGLRSSVSLYSADRYSVSLKAKPKRKPALFCESERRILQLNTSQPTAAIPFQVKEEDVSLGVSLLALQQ